MEGVNTRPGAGNSTDQFLQNYLKFGVFVHIFCSLSVQDEFRFVGNSHYVILHGVTQKSDGGDNRQHNIQPHFV